MWRVERGEPESRRKPRTKSSVPLLVGAHEGHLRSSRKEGIAPLQHGTGPRQCTGNGVGDTTVPIPGHPSDIRPATLAGQPDFWVVLCYPSR